MTKRHPIPLTRSSITLFLFVGLVLLSGWYPAYLIPRMHWTLGWYPSPEVTLLLTLLGVGPGLAAWLAASFGHMHFRSTFGFHVGKPIIILPAWFLLPLLAILAASITVLLGQADWDWNMLTSLQETRSQWPDNAKIIQFYPKNTFAFWGGLILLGPLIWFLPAWLEETAWRGFCYKQLINYGFWPTAFLTAVLTWLWKLPYYWMGYGYPDHPKLGLGLSFLFVLFVSILLTWLRRASGSIWAPTIARATLASSAIFPLSITTLYDPVFAHLRGIIGLSILAIFIGCAWLLGLFKPPLKP